MNSSEPTTPKQSTSIEVFGGKFIDIFAPDFDLFEIEAIAHHLSNQCRFSGATSRHYSVAEHSVQVSKLAAKLREKHWSALMKNGVSFPSFYSYVGHTTPRYSERQGLMHDGSEFVLVDLPRPIKGGMPAYREIETPIQTGIYDMLGIPSTMSPMIEEIDMRICITEKIAFMGSAGLDRPEWTPLTSKYAPFRYSWLPEWLDKLVHPKASKEITVYFAWFMPPWRAKRVFLKQYRRLFKSQ